MDEIKVLQNFAAEGKGFIFERKFDDALEFLISIPKCFALNHKRLK